MSAMTRAEKAKKVLVKALSMDNAYAIKNYVEVELRKAGLGRLVRDQVRDSFKV